MKEKKVHELKYGKFFIEKINERYDFDYIPSVNEEESKKDGDVDIYGKSNKYQELKIQCTLGRPEIPKMFADLRKEAKKSDIGYAIGEGSVFSIPALVGNSLARKDYPIDQQRQLILLIEYQYGPLFDRDYVKQVFQPFTNTEYKGVFIVKIPQRPESSNAEDSGQVIAIKNPFGEDCDVI